MNKKNKYGCLSGGYIFDYLDKLAHKLSIAHIGECVTVSANIDYITEITEEELQKLYCRTKVVNKRKIVVSFEGEIFARFIFIKKKDEKKDNN